MSTQPKKQRQPKKVGKKWLMLPSDRLDYSAVVEIADWFIAAGAKAP